jgi:hypothetical protein
LKNRARNGPKYPCRHLSKSGIRELSALKVTSVDVGPGKSAYRTTGFWSIFTCPVSAFQDLPIFAKRQVGFSNYSMPAVRGRLTV